MIMFFWLASHGVPIINLILKTYLNIKTILDLTKYNKILFLKTNGNLWNLTLK